MNEIVQRTEIIPYMNTATSSTSPVWTQMGDGWTKFKESPSAQTKSKKYINETEERETVTRYKPKFDFECDLMHTDATIKKIYDIQRKRAVGSDVNVELLVVDAFGTEPEDGFPARRMTVAAAVDSIDGDDDMTMTGSFNCQGKAVYGKFKSGAFTEDE